MSTVKLRYFKITADRGAIALALAVLAMPILMTSIRGFADETTPPAFDSGAMMTKLSQGWPESLAPLEQGLDPSKAYLIVVSKPPQAHIDFRSAENLRGSILATPEIQVEEIGHNLFGWSCPRFAGGAQKGFTSQSGEFQSQTLTMLMTGWGVTTLFSTFTDGVLRTPAENEIATLKPYLNAPDFHLFAFLQEVSDEQCAGVVNFMRNYSKIDPWTHRYPGQNFGLGLDPAKLEGGGCGTVAVTALDRGGFFGDFASDFWRVISFSKTVFGRPLELKTKATIPKMVPGVPRGQERPFNILETMNWSPKSAADTVSLRAVDPEMMFLFYKTMLQGELALEAQNGQSSAEERSRIASVLDRKMPLNYYMTRPEIGGFHIEPIDETYDTVAADLVKKSRAWLSGKMAEGYQLERVKFGTQLALRLMRKP